METDIHILHRENFDHAHNYFEFSHFIVKTDFADLQKLWITKCEIQIIKPTKHVAINEGEMFGEVNETLNGNRPNPR